MQAQSTGPASRLRAACCAAQGPMAHGRRQVALLSHMILKNAWRLPNPTGHGPRVHPSHCWGVDTLGPTVLAFAKVGEGLRNPLLSAPPSTHIIHHVGMALMDWLRLPCHRNSIHHPHYVHPFPLFQTLRLGHTPPHISLFPSADQRKRKYLLLNFVIWATGMFTSERLR